MGSTTFYETVLTARELATSVRPAREGDDWAGQEIDDRLQREINMARVKQTIVPYLAQHPDRFFGSFIVLARAGSIEFEPLADFGDKLPAAYRNSVDNVGFLTIGSGELIALDGQHRLVAFREVITNPNENGQFAAQVGDDEVCVLFIEFETVQKTRRIFNKVNRNAKPTGRSDNIITSEDDGFAIVTRRLLDRTLDGPLARRDINGVEEELVNWTTTTLNKASRRLTTISAVYETVTAIVQDAGFKGFSEKDDPSAPPEVELAQAFDIVSEWWDRVLRMPVFVDALSELSNISVVRFANDHPLTLLLRPVGQIALVKGLLLAIERADGALNLDAAVGRAELIDWSAKRQGQWRDVLVKPDGRMIATKDSYELAAELIAYLIADEWTTDEDRTHLYNEWNERRGHDPYGDPENVDDESMPEELPPPVLVK